MSTVVMARGSVPTPERTLQQRREALENANRIRSARAELKRDIKAGRRSVVQLVGAPPEFIDSMRIFDLLLAAPKVGRVKANRWLSRARVSPSKTLGGLSERQRMELVALIGRR